MIDDDPAFRALVSYHLRKLGAEVKLFEDGFEAIKLINTSINQPMSSPTIDAVVVDLRMPRIDGYATITRLRTEGYRGRIIALSASFDAGSQEASTNAGCDKILAKPVEPMALFSAIIGAEIF